MTGVDVHAHCSSSSCQQRWVFLQVLKQQNGKDKVSQTSALGVEARPSVDDRSAEVHISLCCVVFALHFTGCVKCQTMQAKFVLLDSAFFHDTDKESIAVCLHSLLSSQHPPPFESSHILVTFCN